MNKEGIFFQKEKPNIKRLECVRRKLLEQEEALWRLKGKVIKLAEEDNNTKLFKTMLNLEIT